MTAITFRWIKLAGTDLLPGDVVSIGRSSGPNGEDRAVPADMLLLAGSAIVNEAILTGESTPQWKVVTSFHIICFNKLPLFNFGFFIYKCINLYIYTCISCAYILPGDDFLEKLRWSRTNTFSLLFYITLSLSSPSTFPWRLDAASKS